MGLGDAGLFVVRLRERARLLRSRAVVVELIELLNDVAEDCGCGCEAFCFLTNELRVVIVPNDDRTDARSAFIAFKDASARWFRDSGFPGWNDRFFSRRLRTADERRNAIDEVLSAPVLAGSGESTRQYPFVGPMNDPEKG